MKKSYKITKQRPKRHKKKSLFWLRHPLVFPVTTFIVLFFVGLIVMVLFGSSTQGAADARIVNVYADGDQRTVTTRAKTIGELLERLDVPLIEQDIVEPKADTLILEDNTQINIYRARPVEIIEGDRRISILTAQRAPRLVAEEAGIVLAAEDTIDFERSSESVLESGIAEQLVIKRAVELQLNVYGVIKSLKTTANTVDELLRLENIILGDGDTIAPARDSAIAQGLLISINKPGVTTAVTTEAIPFAVETKDDANLQAGKTAVERAGIDGERAVVYEVTLENGVETGRREIQQVVLRQPTSEVRLRGTKIVAPSFDPSTEVSGDKIALMSAAGISADEYAYVDYIISKESRWRPGVANSSSGAYGLCQALPASKMASAGSDYLSNPVTQLKWCSGYANGRYGSWAGAYSAWLAQGWW